MTANWLDSDDPYEEAANAHLIASAPDLLEALEVMVSSDSWYQGAHLIKARAAIAKARGET
jgi:hypothetical protein